MAALAGANYEKELANKLWDRYKETDCSKTGKTNITYETLQPEPAGSSSGSDLASVTKWTIDGKGEHTMNVNIEVKNIKAKGRCTAGLDFGQYTLVYILNKKTNDGKWFPNVDGKTWKAKDGKNQPLILATVNVLNNLNLDTSGLPPRPSKDKLDIWSLAAGKKRKATLKEAKWNVNDADNIVIQGLKEEHFRPPNSLVGNKFEADALKEGERPTQEANWVGCMLAMKGPRTSSDISVPTDTANAMLEDIKNYYLTKGDDLIQIKKYGLFTLKDKSQYGEYPFVPPVPDAWYDSSFSFVDYVLNNPETGIKLRLRYKYHTGKKSSFRDWTCAIKFDFNTKLQSSHSLDNSNDIGILADYWCDNFRALSLFLEENEDSADSIFGTAGDSMSGCSIMGGSKKTKKSKRSRRSRKTKKSKKSKKSKRSKRSRKTKKVKRSKKTKKTRTNLA